MTTEKTIKLSNGYIVEIKSSYSPQFMRVKYGYKISNACGSIEVNSIFHDINEALNAARDKLKEIV